MIKISLVTPTILKKFLLMAFFASGLFITNKAIPEKKKRRRRTKERKIVILAESSVTHT